MRMALTFIYIGIGLSIVYLVLNGVGKALNSISSKLIGF